MLNKHYKLAIIIAAHKSADKIRIVLDSISRQAGFNQIQIIVKDSGNDNNIKKIIDSYLKLDIKLIISSDCGIYDAWNQALVETNAKWVLFLGDDDSLLDVDLVEEFINMIPARSTLIYGKILKENKKGVYELVSKSWGELEKRFFLFNGMPHQGVFHHISLFEKFGFFDTGYKVAGDFDFLIRVIQKGIEPEFIPLGPIAKMAYGGISTVSSGRLLVLKEFKSIRKKFSIRQGMALFELYFLYLKIKSYFGRFS